MSFGTTSQPFPATAPSSGSRTYLCQFVNILKNVKMSQKWHKFNIFQFQWRIVFGQITDSNTKQTLVSGPIRPLVGVRWPGKWLFRVSQETILWSLTRFFRFSRRRWNLLQPPACRSSHISLAWVVDMTFSYSTGSLCPFVCNECFPHIPLFIYSQ